MANICPNTSSSIRTTNHITWKASNRNTRPYCADILTHKEPVPWLIDVRSHMVVQSWETYQMYAICIINIVSPYHQRLNKWVLQYCIATSKLLNARIMILVFNKQASWCLGSCKYANSCSFAHGDHELRKMGDPVYNDYMQTAAPMSGPYYTF